MAEPSELTDGELTDGERRAVLRGIRTCYLAAGLRPPVVHWLRAPVEGDLPVRGEAGAPRWSLDGPTFAARHPSRPLTAGQRASAGAFLVCTGALLGPPVAAVAVLAAVGGGVAALLVAVRDDAWPVRALTVALGVAALVVGLRTGLLVLGWATVQGRRLWRRGTARAYRPVDRRLARAGRWWTRRSPGRGLGQEPGQGLGQGPRRRPVAARTATDRVLWRPYRRVVVVLEPPVEVHVGPHGLHRDAGPAVVWADGSLVHALHGVRVDRDPAAGDWTVEEIHATPNSEARRVMIEAIGWPEYARRAGLTTRASAPDPGNAPHRLVLLDLPREHCAGVRLLLMVNGSPGRSGERRRYAELVPARFDDPVEAAAWQYGVPVEVYRALERRT